MEANKEQPCMCCYLYLLVNFLFPSLAQRRCNKEQKSHIFKYAQCTSKPLSSRSMHMSTYVRYFPFVPNEHVTIYTKFTHFPMECRHFFLHTRTRDWFKCTATAHGTNSENHFQHIHQTVCQLNIFSDLKNQHFWLCVEFHWLSAFILSHSFTHISINCWRKKKHCWYWLYLD